jgi:hypothetical protein
MIVAGEPSNSRALLSAASPTPAITTLRPARGK